MNSFQRIDAAISLKIPDRVPLAPLLDHFAATYAGITNADLMSDPDKRIAAVLKVSTELRWDMTYIADIANPGLLKMGVPAKLLMPGVDLPANSVHQFDEKGYMTVEDYDLLANNGLIPFLAKIMTAIYPDLTVWELLRDLGAVSEEINQHCMRVRDAGIAPAVGFVIPGPSFEYFSLARGIKDGFRDLFVRPDKIRAAGKKYCEGFIGLAIGTAQMNGVKRVFIGLSRTSSTFISPKHFEALVLPDLDFLVNGLIEAGITPLLHCDTDWTKFLHYFKAFPRGKCIMNLDGFTDIFKAKEILGDTMVIMGDVPATLLATGGKNEVMAYCRRLIEVVGKGGGFILSTGCSIPANAKIENVVALTEAVEEWGWY